MFYEETQIKNSKYWLCVTYPENMVDGWKEKAGDILQLPYAYAEHPGSDNGQSKGKDHVHWIVVWPNTTTKAHAMHVFAALSAEGKKCFNTIQAAVDVGAAYNYLIHDTESCRKLGKELYSANIRIEGNNFDIHHYRQLDAAQKADMVTALTKMILDEGIPDFASLSDRVLYAEDFDAVAYFEILVERSAFFERVTRGVYQRAQRAREVFKEATKKEEFQSPFKEEDAEEEEEKVSTEEEKAEEA